MMKKWFFILLALGFSFTTVHADDDEYWDDEEEEVAPKKAASKAKAKAKSASAGDSRMGLYTSFGASSPTIGFVYDLGSGMQFGLGVGLDRKAVTKIGADEEVSSQTIIAEPIMIYELGKGLLNYGIGVKAFYKSTTVGDGDAVTSMGAVPSFYVSTALVPNVALSLNAGLRVTTLGENSTVTDFGLVESGMLIEAETSLMLIFYFM